MTTRDLSVICAALAAALLLALAGVSYWGGYREGVKATRIEPKTKADTTIIHDTITVPEPPKTAEKTVERILVPVVDSTALDSLKERCAILQIHNDSLCAVLTRTQAYYHQDSLYDVWVSGFRPSLDSLKVYPTTKVVTIEKTFVREPSRWNFQATAGPVVMVDVHGQARFGGGIAVGFGYRF